MTDTSYRYKQKIRAFKILFIQYNRTTSLDLRGIAKSKHTYNKKLRKFSEAGI